MKLLIAAGGTGGHIYPALSIGKIFRSEGHKVMFAGRKGSLEEEVYKKSGFPVANIRSSLLDFSPGAIFKFFTRTAGGVKDAFKVLKSERPDAVLGGGGYVSAPILFAARLAGVPYFIYEQNIVPGRTNRIFGKYAKLIFTGFPDIYDFFDSRKTVFSGNPVRPEILKVKKSEGLAYFGFSKDFPVLLVFGGSGGASAINKTFSAICAEFVKLSKAQVIFITGKRDFPEIREKLNNIKSVKVLPYLDKMEFAYAVSDIAVSRAGAMTLTELALTHTFGIVIPFPFARDNHQFKNALYLQERGCVDIIDQKRLSGNMLLNKLVYYLHNTAIIDKINCTGVFPADSAEIIYEHIMEKING